jgi:hypothetical protein
MDPETDKINALAEAYIEALTEAFTRMAEIFRKVINIFEECIPKLKEALEKAYEDKILEDTFGTSDKQLILSTMNKGKT